MSACERFPRSARLLSAPEFKRVYRRGGRIHRSHLVFRVLATDAPGSRFGLSVSKKVGNAVRRNQVKRWLREAIRRNRHGLVGLDVVVIARPGAGAAGYHVLYDEVASALASLRSSP